MNNASDHGYCVDWSIKVAPGLVFRHMSAEGIHKARVVRRHRDHGYWECVWLSGPRTNGIWIRRAKEILADCYAP